MSNFTWWQLVVVVLIDLFPFIRLSSSSLNLSSLRGHSSSNQLKQKILIQSSSKFVGVIVTLKTKVNMAWSRSHIMPAKLKMTEHFVLFHVCLGFLVRFLLFLQSTVLKLMLVLYGKWLNQNVWTGPPSVTSAYSCPMCPGSTVEWI